MKKVLSMVLAVVLVLGMGSMVFATKYAKDDLKLGLCTATVEKGGEDATLDKETDRKVIFTIYASATGAVLNKADVRDSKIAVQIRASEGSAVVDGAKIVYNTTASSPSKADSDKTAQVEFKLKEKYVTTKDIDFLVKLFVTVDKSRSETAIATVSGTYKNAMITVSEGEEYVNLTDTPIVEADDYIKNIEVYLGQGVSIFTRMFEGKKYYGAVSQEVTADDEAVFNAYPDITTVYKLDTINLNATGDTVKFDIDGNLYIYVQDEDGNLVFLGRTNDRVPYFTKYFLASKELDVAVEEEETEVPEEEGSESEGPESELPEIDGETGGDDAPENVNDNPGTGR